MERNNFSKKKLYPLVIAAFLIGMLLFIGNKRKEMQSINTDPDAKTAEIVKKIISEEAANSNVVENDLVPALTTEDQKKWSELQDIMKTKNDNDPRLDRDFKKMSDSMHDTLKEKYAGLPAEERNQRGLIAFLIARDLKSTSDLEFLKKIYEESPCLSLENCSSRTSSDPHLSGVDQASMNYPQLVTLYQLEKQLTERSDFFKDPQLIAHAKAVLDQASKFPVPAVQIKAEEIQKKFQL